MSLKKSCSRCGAELRPHSAEGFCVRCLLESGLDERLAESEADRLDELRPGTPRSDPAPTSPVHDGRRYFGDYELLEEIARGGMGVIYRARQVSLGRIVAVKMILAGQFASQQTIQRFRGEVTAAALLQHPNIVAIHDVGIHDDQHYFSMDYVEGQNLSQLVGNRPLAPEKAARYLKVIAEAIHYAHQQGILHRDLKPSNVLIDRSDQPRITDFGLAKRLDGDASMTVTGQMLGSPNFMPPEQAGSHHGKVGRHSDVYGLGAILYHLLTGRPPFQADSFESVITQVLHTEPVSPRLLNSSVPPDLETICVKCLQKEPMRRYQTPQEVADELGRFLRDEPIHARPVTRLERARRWRRRNPVVAGLGVALALAIMIGLATVSWQLRRARFEAAATRRNLYTADMQLALQAWEKGDLQPATDHLVAHLPQRGKEDLRGFEWRYLWKLCQDESRATTNLAFAGARHGLALSADDKTIIAASGNSLKWLDRELREVQSLRFGRTPVTGLAMATGHPGLIAFRTDRVKMLSSTGEPLLGGEGLAPELGGWPDPEYDGNFALSADGTLLAATGPNNTIRIFDVKTNQPLGPEAHLAEGALSLAFSPDAKYLACASVSIEVLEVPTLKRSRLVPYHTAFVTSLAFDPTGTKLVSGSNDSHIRIWSFPDCQRMADLNGHLGMIRDLAFSPDGLRLASAGSDDTVRLWTLASPDAPTFLRGHRGSVNSVLFSRDGNQLYSGSDDGTLKAWNVTPRTTLTDTLRISAYSDEVSFSPDGTLVAVADFTAGNASLWRLPAQERIGTVGDHAVPCRGVKFSTDGKLLATMGQDEALQISDVSTRQRIFTVSNLPGDFGVAFHPHKPVLALGCGELRFLDLRNQASLDLLSASPRRGVHRVAFSLDGNRIALGMQDGHVSVWNFKVGRCLWTFQEHTNQVESLCFSHDGAWLGSGGEDCKVVLYDMRKGRAQRMEGHKCGVYGLAFAPGDKTLVSTSRDGRILFWSMANHQIALELIHKGGPVNSVAFSPKGNLMATAGSGGMARLWPAANFDEISPQRSKVNDP